MGAARGSGARAGGGAGQEIAASKSEKAKILPAKVDKTVPGLGHEVRRIPIIRNVLAV